MRAHFAGDVTNSEDSSDALDDKPSLQTRINEFKRDEKNMEELNEFLDDLILKAETEATKQQQAINGKSSQQPKEKSRQSFSIPDFKNGKVVNRARGLVVRIFDAICNCANTAVAPASRIKLRGKRTANATNDINPGTENDLNDAKSKRDKKKQIEQQQEQFSLEEQPLKNQSNV